MRQGPHSRCSINTWTGPTSQRLVYHCWVYGDNIFDVNTWTWVHKEGHPEADGWVLDYYLEGGGASVHC